MEAPYPIDSFKISQSNPKHASVHLHEIFTVTKTTTPKTSGNPPAITDLTIVTLFKAPIGWNRKKASEYWAKLRRDGTKGRNNGFYVVQEKLVDITKTQTWWPYLRPKDPTSPNITGNTADYTIPAPAAVPPAPAAPPNPLRTDIDFFKLYLYRMMDIFYGKHWMTFKVDDIQTGDVKRAFKQVVRAARANRTLAVYETKSQINFLNILNPPLTVDFGPALFEAALNSKGLDLKDIIKIEDYGYTTGITDLSDIRLQLRSDHNAIIADLHRFLRKLREQHLERVRGVMAIIRQEYTGMMRQINYGGRDFSPKRYIHQGTFSTIASIGIQKLEQNDTVAWRDLYRKVGGVEMLPKNELYRQWKRYCKTLVDSYRLNVRRHYVNNGKITGGGNGNPIYKSTIITKKLKLDDEVTETLTDAVNSLVAANTIVRTEQFSPFKNPYITISGAPPPATTAQAAAAAAAATLAAQAAAAAATLAAQAAAQAALDAAATLAALTAAATAANRLVAAAAAAAAKKRQDEADALAAQLALEVAKADAAAAKAQQDLVDANARELAEAKRKEAEAKRKELEKITSIGKKLDQIDIVLQNMDVFITDTQALKDTQSVKDVTIEDIFSIIAKIRSQITARSDEMTEYSATLILFSLNNTEQTAALNRIANITSKLTNHTAKLKTIETYFKTEKQDDTQKLEAINVKIDVAVNDYKITMADNTTQVVDKIYEVEDIIVELNDLVVELDDLSMTQTRDDYRTKIHTAIMEMDKYKIDLKKSIESEDDRKRRKAAEKIIAEKKRIHDEKLNEIIVHIQTIQTSIDNSTVGNAFQKQKVIGDLENYLTGLRQIDTASPWIETVLAMIITFKLDSIRDYYIPDSTAQILSKPEGVDRENEIIKQKQLADRILEGLLDLKNDLNKAATNRQVHTQLFERMERAEQEIQNLFKQFAPSGTSPGTPPTSPTGTPPPVEVSGPVLLTKITACVATSDKYAVHNDSAYNNRKIYREFVNDLQFDAKEHPNEYPNLNVLKVYKKSKAVSTESLQTDHFYYTFVNTPPEIDTLVIKQAPNTVLRFKWPADLNPSKKFVLVQEKKGETLLHEILNRVNGFNETEQHDLRESAMKVLEQMHRVPRKNGGFYLHRDIKADNLVINKQNGELVLFDFDICKNTEEAMQDTVTINKTTLPKTLNDESVIDIPLDSKDGRINSKFNSIHLDYYQMGIVMLQLNKQFFTAPEDREDLTNLADVLPIGKMTITKSMHHKTTGDQDVIEAALTDKNLNRAEMIEAFNTIKEILVLNGYDITDFPTGANKPVINKRLNEVREQLTALKKLDFQSKKYEYSNTPLSRDAFYTVKNIVNFFQTNDIKKNNVRNDSGGWRKAAHNAFIEFGRSEEGAELMAFILKLEKDHVRQTFTDLFCNQDELEKFSKEDTGDKQKRVDDYKDPNETSSLPSNLQSPPQVVSLNRGMFEDVQMEYDDFSDEELQELMDGANVEDDLEKMSDTEFATLMDDAKSVSSTRSTPINFVATAYGDSSVSSENDGSSSESESSRKGIDFDAYNVDSNRSTPVKYGNSSNSSDSNRSTPVNYGNSSDSNRSTPVNARNLSNRSTPVNYGNSSDSNRSTPVNYGNSSDSNRSTPVNARNLSNRSTPVNYGNSSDSNRSTPVNYGNSSDSNRSTPVNYRNSNSSTPMNVD